MNECIVYFFHFRFLNTNYSYGIEEEEKNFRHKHTLILNVYYHHRIYLNEAQKKMLVKCNLSLIACVYTTILKQSKYIHMCVFIYASLLLLSLE